ncbi:MAG: ABC transporter substrate-binding protein [Eubacteriales bacterium]
MFKKQEKTKITALLLVMLMVLSVFGTACTKSDDGGSEGEASDLSRLENKEEVRVAMMKGDPNFDPCMGWGKYGNALLQSKLMEVVDGEIVEDLATEHTISADGLVWTFKIRDDVKFHDGEPLTAEDVAFTFNKTKSLASSIDLTNLKEAVAIDDTTVEFRMEAPFSPFLSVSASLGIVPKHAYKDTEQYSKNPIGSGPLKFVQYDNKQQIIFERNEDYYKDKVKFKRVVVLSMDTDAAFAALKSGEVDVAITNEAAAKKGLDGFRLESVESYDYRVISMPCVKAGGTTDKGDPIGNDVTSDIAIRKALAVGIDRSQLIENVLLGYGEPTFDTFGKFEWGIRDEVADFKDGDIEKAKKILDDAGWVEKDGIREKDGLKAEFNLMYPSSDISRQAIAMGFTEEAKKLGIKVTPEGFDWDVIAKNMKAKPLVLGGGANNPMVISDLYDSKFAKTTGWKNAAAYENKETDLHIKKALEATDEATAYSEWKKALWDGKNGGSILGDTAYVPICFIRHLFFVRDGLDIGKQGKQGHDHGIAILGNITEWDYQK